MQELEKILEEIESKEFTNMTIRHSMVVKMKDVRSIIRKHMNDGWIPVEERLPKDYETVNCIDCNDYYFVAVYDKRHGFKTNDIGAYVSGLKYWKPIDLHRPEKE